MTKKKYPFKFLDSYTKEDTDIFFGRDEEVEMLYEMVHQTDILVVYGASGTGKTSLIRCGLASKFQSHDWLAINIRRGHDLNASLENELNRAGESLQSEDIDDLDWLDSLMPSGDATGIERPDNTMDKMFKAIYRRYFRPIYLIFDQFEELYLLGSTSEQKQFVQSVKEILQVDQPITLIFVIREEYLGYLYEFEKEVPQLMRRKLRVEAMTLDKVRQVLIGVSKFDKTIISIEEGREDEIADTIFNKIKGTDKTLTIQLPYLQVFLDNLYLKITKDKKREKEAVLQWQPCKK